MSSRTPIHLTLVTLLLLSACAPEESAAPATAATTSPSATAASDGTTIIDPAGDYKLFSDPSISKPPVPDMVFGKGQTLSVDYDGSKTGEGDSLFYRLYFVRPNGQVHQIADRVFEDGRTKGTFSTSSKVFDSDANGRPGFIELFVVTDIKLGTDGSAPSSKTIRLGMYPIRFEVE